MNQEQSLTAYILEKYQPLAILLHGSRASGNAREHSDWDFAIIVDKDVELNRESINDANVEISILKLPFNENSIGDKWLSLRKGNVKVLHDPKVFVNQLLKKSLPFMKNQWNGLMEKF